MQPVTFLQTLHLIVSEVKRPSMPVVELPDAPKSSPASLSDVRLTSFRMAQADAYGAAARETTFTTNMPPSRRAARHVSRKSFSRNAGAGQLMLRLRIWVSVRVRGKKLVTGSGKRLRGNSVHVPSAEYGELVAAWFLYEM